MDRSRSSKRYYYEHQDYDSSDIAPRTKPRYNNTPAYSNHRPPPRNAGATGGRKLIEPSMSVTTSYRILCHDSKAGGVIGKSGSIIKSIRQHTGAWINVHELIPGDEERIIEISDTRRKDPDGRMPTFSPAQEALFMIHERILESEVAGGPGGGAGEDGYGGYGNGGRGGEKQMVTRLVVSRLHVGSLLGKGGKIIEQMRSETKTHIRVLPRDHTLPRCVSMSEEIVQVVGGMTAVKNAVAIISSRLRESQHRDRGPFQGHAHSPDRFVPPNDDLIPHMNGTHRSPVDGTNFGSKFSAGRGDRYSSRHFDSLDAEETHNRDNAGYFTEDIVFRILCPTEKVDSVVGETDGIIDILHNEVGVDVKVADPVAGSNEQIIIVTSDEGPDDDLFPAQEALLHIQTRIVDLEPDKENVITTRLLLHLDEILCFDGKRGSLTSIKKIAGVEVEILPREELPVYVSDSDEIVQIVGEIRAAREALLEVTSKLRTIIHRGFSHKDTLGPFVSASGTIGNNLVSEGGSDSNRPPSQDDQGSETSSLNRQTVASTAAQPSNITTAKSLDDSVAGSGGTVKLNERREEVPSGLNRISIPFVTRSTLEVVIPPHVASKLVIKSRNKLVQISELSGANVQFTDNNPDAKEKVIQISGTPEQAEKAQSLLQGFILSIEEDGP